MSCSNGIQECSVIVFISRFYGETHFSDRLGETLQTEVALMLAGIALCIFGRAQVDRIMRVQDNALLNLEKGVKHVDHLLALLMISSGDVRRC